MVTTQKTNVCSICGKLSSKSGYCDDCLRIHRRENNDVNLFSWVLDHNSKPCPLCLKPIEYTCEVELHHLYGETWSKGQRKDNNGTNLKISEIKKWIIIGKIPDNIIVMHKCCHSSLNFADPYEVARHYPNHIDKYVKLTYDPYKQAYEHYVNDPSLREQEKRRVSLMGKFAKENYMINIRAIKKKLGLDFERLFIP